MERASLAAALAASLLLGLVLPASASDEIAVEGNAVRHDVSSGNNAEGECLPDDPVPRDRAADLGDHLEYLRELAAAGPAAALQSPVIATDERPRRVVRPAKPMVIITASLAERRAAEEQLLGSADDARRLRELLPYTREIAVDGTVDGSFGESAVAAGVPAPAMLEVLEAFALGVDLARDVEHGTRFHIRYEQEFTAAGASLDVGRVLWAELRTAKGTVGIHRFHARDDSERFWLTNGLAMTPPSMRLPLDVVSISSGFGLRADPFDQPPPRPTAGTSRAMGGTAGRAAAPKLPPGLPTGGALDMPRVNVATPLGASMGLSSYGAVRPPGGFTTGPRAGRSLFMHEGIDLVAPAGTPVHAAADGVVIGAAPNGRYGNWIRIEHGDKLETVYGHLSGFAPGIEAGVTVARGDVIGFVGSTGRSTGAHLHFELLSGGKPVNPVIHPETKRAQLRGVELERFRKQVARSLAERDREGAVAKLYAD